MDWCWGGECGLSGCVSTCSPCPRHHPLQSELALAVHPRPPTSAVQGPALASDSSHLSLSAHMVSKRCCVKDCCMLRHVAKPADTVEVV